MTDQAPELLPCPFCGSDQLKISPNIFTGLLRVQCEGCWATSVTSNQRSEVIEKWNTRPPSERPVAQVREASSVDWHQQRGRHFDIIQEAIATYDEWMLDDDYDATSKLHQIMKQMRERAALTAERPEAVRENLTAEEFAQVLPRPEAAVAMIERSEFEIVRKASRLFEDAANAWMERALKAEAALAIQHEEPGREVTPAMIDAALTAWFKSPPSETDQGLERSMKAALQAALSPAQRDIGR